PDGVEPTRQWPNAGRSRRAPMTIHEPRDGHQPTADVGSQRVARVYAEALLNAAAKSGQADAVLDELDSLGRDVCQTHARFEAFLTSAAVSRHHKEELLQKVFQGRASQVFFNFLMVLNRHERLDLLRPIQTTAREIQNQRAGRIPVQVRSAVALPPDQRDRLR